MKLKLRLNITAPLIDSILPNIINHMKNTPYPLRDHQITGVEWLIKQEIDASKKSGMLCDDPGLGKTIQIAALIKALELDKTLIIVPPSVVHQWKEVLINVLGDDKVYIHTGLNRIKTVSDVFNTRKKLEDNARNFTVAITTYGLIFNKLNRTEWDPEKAKTILHLLKWDRIILDEGHLIRNSKTKIFEMCSMLTARHRWILTGTPIQNSKNDIRCLMKFLNVKNAPVQDLISDYVMRRTKKILIDNNGTFEDYNCVNHICKFKTKEEQNIYEAIEKDAIDRLNETNNNNPYKMNMVLLELILRLRQASIHPNIAMSSIEKKNVNHRNNECKFKKLNCVSTKITTLIEKIKKVNGLSLIFCHFRQEMKMISDNLAKENIKSRMYDGSMNRQQRIDVINQYDVNNGKKILKKINGKYFTKKIEGPTVLIIQIKAGGVGLNLQKFTNVFIVSPDWNPCNEIQAIARAHRLGQRKKVTVHKFTLSFNPSFKSIIDNEEENSDDKKQLTIDEKILDMQKCKRDIMVDLLNDSTLKFNETIDTDQVFELQRLL